MSDKKAFYIFVGVIMLVGTLAATAVGLVGSVNLWADVMTLGLLVSTLALLVQAYRVERREILATRDV